MRSLASVLFTLSVGMACSGERPEKDLARGSDSPKSPAIFDAATASDAASWVPAEFKGARGKWRDPGVYVDGVPRAFLWYHELPRGLEPVWIESEESLDFKPGDKGPRKRIVKERRFRLVDYLEALGVDMKKVTEVHIFGGQSSGFVVAKKDLLRVRDRFYFDFGREDSGKPRIFIPADLEVATTFDQILSIAVYIERKPPKQVADDEFVLDGKVVEGIPYYGQPLRGGVRFYLDDRLVAVLKRNSSHDIETIARTTADGGHEYELFEFLETRGVSTRDVRRAEVVSGDDRGHPMAREELATMRFVASPRAKGGVLLGPDQLRVNALMLYTSKAMVSAPKR